MAVSLFFYYYYLSAQDTGEYQSAAMSGLLNNAVPYVTNEQTLNRIVKYMIFFGFT